MKGEDQSNIAYSTGFQYHVYKLQRLSNSIFFLVIVICGQMNDRWKP